MNKTQLLIRGEIVFDSLPGDLSNAKIYIRLEDTSFADEEAEVVLEETLARVPILLTPLGRIPFSLNGRLPDPRRSYSVSVHVDMQATGQLSKGDYINTEYFPVNHFGSGKTIFIHVKEV